MDKRYLLIIGIIIICCVNLYIISSFSNIIGDAYFNVGTYTFTLPEGFSVEDSENNHVKIINNDKIRIDIFSYLSSTDNYQNAYKFVSTNNNCELLSNGTIHHNNISIDSIYYRQNDYNSSVFFFNKENNTFKVVISNFNQDTQYNKTIDIITKLAESERFNPRI